MQSNPTSPALPPVTSTTQGPSEATQTNDPIPSATTDTTSVTTDQITPLAKKTRALLGKLLPELSEENNLIVTLTDLDIDALYARIKKTTFKDRDILSIKINKKLLEALSDPNHLQHDMAKDIIDKQLLFAKQKAINLITPDSRIMSVDEYKAKVGLERLKVGFYDDALGSKKDFLIGSMETFIKENKFEKAVKFAEEYFMHNQESIQIFEDYKAGGRHSVQIYSETVFNLPTKQIPVKIKWHSPSSVVNVYARVMKRLKEVESSLSDLGLRRTKSITVLDAPMAGRAEDNGHMLLTIRDDDSPLWTRRVLQHENQHFKTRGKLGDGTTSSNLHQENENQPDSSTNTSKAIRLEHRFMSGNEGPPRLLLSELLSYRVECEPILREFNEPTFIESQDFLDLLSYRRDAKIAIEQLEAIKSTHLSAVERKHLELIKKSWENLDKKLEPHMPEILERLSNHSECRCRMEEYYLLIEEHKKANGQGAYPDLLGQLIDHETNFKFLEGIVMAPEGEFPQELQDRAMKRYMSTKFQADQKDWKITLEKYMFTSEDHNIRHRGYKYAIESFKATSNDEQKAEFLKIFSEHISNEEHWKPLERLLISSEDEVPKEFQDLVVKRYMSPGFQIYHNVTITNLLEAKNGRTRKKAYDCIIEGYKMASDNDKAKYLAKFKLYISLETYFYPLHGLGREQNAPPEFQKTAQERFMDTSIKAELTERLPEMLSEKYNRFAYKYCADFYEWSTQPEEKKFYFSMFENAINTETNTSNLESIAHDKEIPEILRTLALNAINKQSTSFTNN